MKQSVAKCTDIVLFCYLNVTCSIVRVKLYQAFLMSGGMYGRLACGDELLLMEFSKAEGVEDVRIEALEPPASF